MRIRTSSKRVFFCFSLVVVSCLGLFSVNAQDIITMKDGTTVQAKVMEIHLSEIRYKRIDNLSGPMFVIPKDLVLSIKYENGVVDIINALTAAEPPAAVHESAQADVPDFSAGGHGGIPAALQTILNALPAIPIAGNNLKFIFEYDKWTATVNGENFSAGIIEIEDTDDGSILTLKQTHIWPGAVGKTAGRIAGKIPGASAVSGVLDTAGNIAGEVGAIESSGPDIVLEYKKGPPAKLSLVRSASPETASRPRRPRTGDSSNESSVPADPHSVSSQLWSIGASVGTSFATPSFIGTLHGTVAPFKTSFIELGMDFGFGTARGYQDASYFLVYPFAHYAFFVPFNKRGGWYAGAGCGFNISTYTFPEGKLPMNYFVAAITTGFNLWDAIDISWTLRTNFKGAINKVSVGYVYRFK